MNIVVIRKMMSGLLALILGLAPLGASAGEHNIASPDIASADMADADILGLGGITPVGMWEADNKESRYQVTLCGDGTQLCAELVWIRPRDINRRNKPYINTYVVYEAVRARPAEWKGDINIYGTKYGGSVKIINQNKLLLTGCIFILCETFELNRRRNPDGTRVNISQADQG